MKNCLFLGLVTLLACTPAVETTSPDTVDNVGIQTEDFPIFPDEYLGRWAGELIIYNAEGVAQEVPMQLHLEPVDDSTYTYTIIYGEDLEAGTRPYLLKEVDRTKGHWYVDEQNTILLDGYYLGGVFYEPFAVGNSALTAMLEKRGDQLLYGITAGPREPVRTTGDQVYSSDTIPAVDSYRLNVYQRAVLNRIPEVEVDSEE